MGVLVGVALCGQCYMGPVSWSMIMNIVGVVIWFTLRRWVFIGWKEGTGEDRWDRRDRTVLGRNDGRAGHALHHTACTH